MGLMKAWIDVHVLQTSDLRIKLHSSFALLLSKLQLPAFILPNICYIDILAEFGKYLVFCFIDDRSQLINLVFQSIIRRLCLTEIIQFGH